MWQESPACAGLFLRLFVGNHLANGGDFFLDSGDFFRPGASGVIGVGDTGGVLAFGLGEMLEQDVESVLEGGAGHRERLSLWQAADIGYAPE